MALTSKNISPHDHDEQRRLLATVIDPARVRAWLIQRIVEHALEIVPQRNKPMPMPLSISKAMLIQPRQHDAVYARYSSPKQNDSTSIEVQLEQTHRHPDIDADVLDYVDRAKSGRALAKRAEFRRLQADIAAKKIKRLFVYRYDRLGRNDALHKIVSDFEKAGCEVISCTEGRDKLVRGIQLVIAKNYSDVLAARTRDGLCKRFEQGTHTGGEPRYGYRVVKGEDERPRVAIDPEEVQVVRKVFTMYLAEPVGCKALARRLDGLGIPTREGGQWSHMTVRGILQNRWLVGERKYKERQFVLDEETGNRLPKWRQESEHMTRRDDSLRVISDVEFEAVQKLIEGRSQPRGAARASNGMRPFTGHLFCAECGSACYARKSENAKGTYHYYNCGCRQRKGPEACPNAGVVREDKLVDLLVGICTDILTDAEAVIAGAMKIGLKHMNAGRDEAHGLERQIADLDAQSRSLTGLMMNPAIDPAALTALSRQIGQKESERKKVEFRLAQVGSVAARGQEKLGQAVRTAYRRAHENFTQITADGHLNRFVEEHIGPMILTSDGRVVPRSLETTTASALAEAVVTISVAGGGFEPPTSGL